MKNNLIIICLLLCSVSAYSQNIETFDIATYEVPKDWTKSAKEGVVNYMASNDAKGAFCIISIYASIPTIGAVDEEFSKVWKVLVADPFKINDAPEKDTSTDNAGRKVVIGSANFNNSGLTGVALLTTYIGFGRTFSVLTLTNDASYQKDVESFLGSLTLKKTSENIPSVSIPKTINKNSANSFHHTNELEGIWMSFHLKSFNYDASGSGAPQWLTFFDNGNVYESIPEQINSFDKNNSKLGNYIIYNGGASLQWSAGTPRTEIIIKNKDEIEVHAAYGNDIYYRCQSIDGARLEGSWTTYNNPNDPDLNDHSIARPMITFSNDGSFIDYGIFSTLLDITVAQGQRTQPGTGTYEINNFTLTLKYNNGVSRQISLTASLKSDITINNNSIYIKKTRFNKRTI